MSLIFYIIGLIAVLRILPIILLLRSKLFLILIQHAHVPKFFWYYT